MPKPITVTEHGAVQFLSTHPTLDRVARTLVQSLAAGDSPCDPTDIWIGAHRTSRVPRTRGRRLVILQTEQILAHDGSQIWHKMTRKRILRQALSADLFVEWNPINRPFYGIMPRLLQNRFLFGPYVFPDRVPQRDPGEGSLFVGAFNARRTDVLARHPETEVLPLDAPLTEIDAAIARSAALCNIHSLPGTYTEVPRVLMAVLAGKPLVSEPLSAPFEAPAYLPLGAPLDSTSLDQSFDTLTDVARRFPLSKVIAKAHRR